MTAHTVRRRFVDVLHRNTMRVGYLADDGTILHEVDPEVIGRTWPGKTVADLHADGLTYEDVDHWLHVVVEEHTT